MIHNTKAIIEVDQLCFDYPGFRALDNIQLRIEAGTVTALVGPNGAGKTTLLRCIAALETPTAGTVRVAGFDVLDDPREVHRRMGFLADNFGLYSELSVAQGLEYAARSHGVANNFIADAVESTAERMGLGEKLGHKAASLSRGQRQRLAIGQAIIHEPAVLLLDEPASGLDPEARALLTGVFQALQAQGMSLLVSSHILAELDEYSTHMLALNQGQVLEHRALQAASVSTALAAPHAAVGTPRRLRLECLTPTAPLAAWLGQQASIHIHAQQTREVEVDFSGTPAEQAALLAACIHAGHQLLTVTAVHENLQQSYLQSLQAQRQAKTRTRGAV